MALRLRLRVYLTFLYQGMFLLILLISKNLQIFINPNPQILCVDGFKISSKIYFKNDLKLKIFKA